MEVTTIGLDIAKNVFQVHGIDAEGRAVLRRKVRRNQLLPLLGGLNPCLIGMEACATAHHWARELTALGHEVRLMPPAYVKAYVKRNKNDAADAEAICEAVTRPTMRFVAVKSAEAQSVLMLHRARHLLVRQRTALVSAAGASRRVRNRRRKGRAHSAISSRPSQKSLKTSCSTAAVCPQGSGRGRAPPSLGVHVLNRRESARIEMMGLQFVREPRISWTEDIGNKIIHRLDRFAPEPVGNR